MDKDPVLASNGPPFKYHITTFFQRIIKGHNCQGAEIETQ